MQELIWCMKKNRSTAGFFTQQYKGKGGVGYWLDVGF